MPTYEYRREDGSTFEIKQRITADPLETCPKTGQKVKRLISGSAGLIFKGEGFYITDYSRSGESPSSSGSASKESNGSSGPSSTQETATAESSGDSPPTGGNGTAKS